MKTRITLKGFSALPFDSGNGTDGTGPANLNAPLRLTPESVHGFHVPLDRSDESLRGMLHQRYTAPFPCESPYHRGGINE